MLNVPTRRSRLYSSPTQRSSSQAVSPEVLDSVSKDFVSLSPNSSQVLCIVATALWSTVPVMIEYKSEKPNRWDETAFPYVAPNSVRLTGGGGSGAWILVVGGRGGSIGKFFSGTSATRSLNKKALGS